MHASAQQHLRQEALRAANVSQARNKLLYHRTTARALVRDMRLLNPRALPRAPTRCACAAPPCPRRAHTWSAYITGPGAAGSGGTPSRMARRSKGVWNMHCRTAFRKHVAPWFFSTAIPGSSTDGGVT
jgi:hypothetical protein